MQTSAMDGVSVYNPRVLLNCCVHGVPKGETPCEMCAQLLQASKPKAPPGMRAKYVCYHGRVVFYCRPCRGSAYCLHYVQRKTCWICRGTEVCKHIKNKAYCAECGGRLLCRVCRTTVVRANKVCRKCRKAQAEADGKAQAEADGKAQAEAGGSEG